MALAISAYDGRVYDDSVPRFIDLGGPYVWDRCQKQLYRKASVPQGEIGDSDEYEGMNRMDGSFLTDNASDDGGSGPTPPDVGDHFWLTTKYISPMELEVTVLGPDVNTYDQIWMGFDTVNDNGSGVPTGYSAAVNISSGVTLLSLASQLAAQAEGLAVIESTVVVDNVITLIPVAGREFLSSHMGSAVNDSRSHGATTLAISSSAVGSDSNEITVSGGPVGDYDGTVSFGTGIRTDLYKFLVPSLFVPAGSTAEQVAELIAGQMNGVMALESAGVTLNATHTGGVVTLTNSEGDLFAWVGVGSHNYTAPN